MSNKQCNLSKLAFAGVVLTLFLSGCGQVTESTAAVRSSNGGAASEEADGKSRLDPVEPALPADSADFVESSQFEARPPDVLGAPSSNSALGSDGQPIVPLTPAPSATDVEDDAPEALPFAAESTSTTATPASSSTPQSSTVPATNSTPSSTPTSSTTTTTTTTTTQAPASTTAAPTTQAPSTVAGRYTIAQVIDGTISAGDGSNPNEEAPMGRHDAPLSLNQGWNWATGPTRNSVWGELGTGGSQYAEWRCAVIPESGHTPSVPFRVNVREGAYYQYANSNWQKAFDVDLTGGNHGGYLGTAGETNGNPFDSGSHGLIEWRREADGSFSAPWNPDALMMHFWASKREAPASGQTAEFLTSEFRLQQPDGQTVDLSQVQVLFQCGVDYYAVTTGQGTQVPGPGIGKYHRLTTEWEPSLWVTLPKDAPANSVSDFRTWLEANLPPGVSN